MVNKGVNQMAIDIVLLNELAEIVIVNVTEANQDLFVNRDTRLDHGLDQGLLPMFLLANAAGLHHIPLGGLDHTEYTHLAPMVLEILAATPLAHHA